MVVNYVLMPLPLVFVQGKILPILSLSFLCTNSASCDWSEIKVEGYHPPGRRSLSAGTVCDPWLVVGGGTL